MKRRFEFVGGSSAKFWEIGIHGSEVVFHQSDGEFPTRSG